MNLKENGILKTINFNNIVEQLNDVTKIIEGNNKGTISDIQLKNLNSVIENLKDKLNNLELNIDKYIDETELTEALKDIKLSLENIVKTSELNSAVSNLTTSLSVLNGKIETLENREVIDTSTFVKINELNTKIESSIKSSIDKIESKFLENSNNTIKTNIDNKITELVGSIDEKIDNKVTELISENVREINNSITDKTKDIVSKITLDNKLKDYANVKSSNTFVNTNNFNIINSTNLNSNVINSNQYNINDNEFIRNDTMLNIGITDKDMNLISKGKLMLNGVEVKNNELPATLLYSDKENNLSYTLSGTVADFNTFKIKNTEVIEKDSNAIKFGSANNITILRGTELFFNNDKIDFNSFIKENNLSNYAKLNSPNTFTNRITGNEIIANNIETSNLKVGGKNVVTDTSNFAKLNIPNTFTQRIKSTEVESNRIITDELLLKGSRINISKYSTNEDLKKQLENIIGLKYGGIIQDNINKIKGKFYFDNATNFYYECVANTTLTYNDTTKFRAISNKPLSDKVESLSEVKEYVFAINGLTNGKIVKIGKLAHLTIDSGTYFYNKGAEAVVLNIPQGFRPRDLVNFSAVNLSNVPNSFKIATNGNVIKVFTDSKNGAYYFSVTYFTD